MPRRSRSGTRRRRSLRGRWRALLRGPEERALVARDRAAASWDYYRRYYPDRSRTRRARLAYRFAYAWWWLVSRMRGAR